MQEPASLAGIGRQAMDWILLGGVAFAVVVTIFGIVMVIRITAPVD